MRKLRQIPLPHWGTLLSSVLIVAAYPPWDLRYLIWICLVPWLFALFKSRTWRLALIQGLWLSILMSILGFHWVAYVLHEFGELPWIVAAIGLALYSLIGQPQFLLFAPVFFFLKSRSPKVLALLGLALIYTGIDWTTPKLFRDTLGHAFYSGPWIRQVAELGGAHLLTFGAIWVNLAIFSVIVSIAIPLAKRHSLTEKFAPLVSLGLSMLLITAFPIFGNIRHE